MTESVPTDLAAWRKAVEPYVSALRMIREAVEEFGPVASLAAREATGGSPEDEAAAIVEALARIRQAIR